MKYRFRVYTDLSEQVFLDGKVVVKKCSDYFEFSELISEFLHENFGFGEDLYYREDILKLFLELKDLQIDWPLYSRGWGISEDDFSRLVSLFGYFARLKDVEWDVYVI